MAKICTTIEQSRKLLELVIDINTADMCWSIDIPDSPTLLAYPIFDCNNWEHKIPAWSLAALLELIPYEIVLDEDESLVLGIHKEDFQYYIEYGNTYSGEIDIDTLLYDDFIDAAFEMVCWLKENEKI